MTSADYARKRDAAASGAIATLVIFALVFALVAHAGLGTAMLAFVVVIGLIAFICDIALLAKYERLSKEK